MTTIKDFWQDPNLPRTLLEALPYGLIVLDADLKVIGFNHWVRVHLPNPDALPGRPLSEAFPAIAARTVSAIEEVIRTGLPRVLSPSFHPAWLPLRHPLSGRPMEVVVRVLPTTQQPGAFLLLEDITERVDYEATLEAEVARRTAMLREREALLRALDAATRQALQAVTDLPHLSTTLTQAFRRLFEAQDALLFITTKSGQLHLLSGRGDLLPSEAPERLPLWRLSLSPEEQTNLQQGKPLWVRDLRPYLHPRQQALPQRSAMLFPLRAVDETPSQALLGVLVLTFLPRHLPPPYLEARGLVVSRTLSLILHWALLYNQMQSQSEVLAREVAQRTQDLQAFVYSVSHDLRAPLRAIVGYAQAVLEDYGRQLPAEGNAFLQSLLAAANRMEHLIEDLLRYSRIASRPPHLQKVALQEVLEEVLLDLYPTIRSREAYIHWTEPLPSIHSDPTLLHQILLNLLDNAVKFVPQGQRPEVTIRVEETMEPRGVRLWVEDNGIGIPPEAQKRIFGMFERLHSPESYPGSGIGLALVRRAVERLNGQVGVISAPQQGSRFWVWLPQPTSSLEAAS